MGLQNIVRTNVARPKAKAGNDAPTFYWSPKGERKLFNSASEVPEGYTPFHPKDAAAKKVAPAPVEKAAAPKSDNSATGGLNRQQIVDALNRKGQKFNPTAATKNLYDLLVAANEADS